MSASVAIIGGGPAGLMAAEALADVGMSVTIYERKPSLARKFLMAGRGGLNITHSEPTEIFLTRYGSASSWLRPYILDFAPEDMRNWCDSLGESTFIGTSGRVFPESFKASPLLRAWITRLESRNVRLALRHEWTGWDDKGDLSFLAPDGRKISIHADATLLALGGGSWPKLGSDGGWVPVLSSRGIPIAPLRPSNCGFSVGWSSVFREKYAGQPLKSVTVTFKGVTSSGDVMIGEKGIEGGAVYALSAPLRDAIASEGAARISIDLRPGLKEQDLAMKLRRSRQGNSFSNFLRKTLNLPPIATGLIYECGGQNLPVSELVSFIKALPLDLNSPFSIDRAISSAGGVALDAVDANLMLKKLPGVFVAGEMLDWEAPTGGYLLQACFATGLAAGAGISRWLAQRN